ncbi:glycosyltransferase [Turicibacter bilis]|nr:glycosyltransferase [Turicibacter bilis]MBS3203737.1 glycosyltransferase [Turicibacter bilis]UUF11100.1 glycosyltransferase [Turicibacter bilis]
MKELYLLIKINQGTAEARKSGLNVAKGEYILFVDGDDWLELNTLEILYENATKNNSDIVLYHAYKTYDNRKEILECFNNEIRAYSIKELLLGNILPSLCFKFIKLDYITTESIQFASHISFAEDLATSCSMVIFNAKVSTVDIPLYNYYIRSNSITNQINSRVLEITDAFNFT